MKSTLSIETACQRLTIDRQNARWELRDLETGQRLLVGDSLCFCAPVLDGIAAEGMQLAGARQSDPQRIELTYRHPGLIEHVVVLEADRDADAIDVTGYCRVEGPCQLNRLDIFPRHTYLNLYEIVNFRNRHHTPQTWPELLLGGAGSITDTYSTDWQFAPHPTALLLRKGDRGLFVGCMDPAPTYGMYLAVQDHRVEHLRLDYGTAPHGLPLGGRQRVEFPRLRWFVRGAKDPYEMYAAFGRMLVNAGRIADPARKERHAWWRAPLYCTWMDQCFGVKFTPPPELKDQIAGATGVANQPVHRILDESFVRRAAALIQRERLGLGVILLDAGWATLTGQWEPHPERFPRFRALIDELHGQGFRVVVWWNWAEIDAPVGVPAQHLIGGGKLNRHGRRMRDYSLPATQEEYLKPLFRKLFSAAPDCYDLDGVKTDFLADKVHADMPPGDPAWRGEENYFVQVTRLFYQEMKRHKPDAMHLGCAGNYRLAEYIDLNRTYDVCSSDWREHENRARMLLATTPGCPVSYDFHNFTENLEKWLASAKQLGAAVEIGNVMYVRDDALAEARLADERYYQTLRQGL